jgi:hypothetical protein
VRQNHAGAAGDSGWRRLAWPLIAVAREPLMFTLALYPYCTLLPFSPEVLKVSMVNAG